MADRRNSFDATGLRKQSSGAPRMDGERWRKGVIASPKRSAGRSEKDHRHPPKEGPPFQTHGKGRSRVRRVNSGAGRRLNASRRQAISTKGLALLEDVRRSFEDRISAFWPARRNSHRKGRRSFAKRTSFFWGSKAYPSRKAPQLSQPRLFTVLLLWTSITLLTCYNSPIYLVIVPGKLVPTRAGGTKADQAGPHRNPASSERPSPAQGCFS